MPVYEHGQIVYYYPHEIHYWRDQVAFLLDNILLLQDGCYPLPPAQSGYVDTNVQKPCVSSKASFIVAADIFSEVTRRGERCYEDYWLFVHPHYLAGQRLEMIARRFNKDTGFVQRRINRVIGYIASGSCPRWVECYTCRTRGICRKKVRGRPSLTYDDYVALFTLGGRE